MADSSRKTIGDALGVALRAIKARDVAAFLSARSDPNAKLSDAERELLLAIVWKAAGKALTPTSPNGSVTIGTAKDANGDDQLTLQAEGGDGASWYVSDGTPSNELGIDGDMCIDLGEPDPEHPRPTRWYRGSGAPSDTLGYENDLYLNTYDGKVYSRGVDSWTYTGLSIIGPPGTNGTDGTDGTDGAPGAPGANGISFAWHGFGGSLSNDSTTPRVSQIRRMDISSSPAGSTWYFEVVGYGNADLIAELYNLTSSSTVATVTIPATTTPTRQSVACTLNHDTPCIYEARFRSATNGALVCLGSATVYLP